MPTVIEQQSRTLTENFSSESAAQNNETPVNEAALLIERMELCEPMKITQAPNYLLETKTYAKVGQNDLVHARPTVIHFEGFEVGKKQVKSLKLLNASSDLMRMHIIPPQTQNFAIKYTKPARMVPGMVLDCKIEFKPDEWRYYYDCIRIHCPGEENLIIPIHGYPVMDATEFPKNFTFQPIAVGSRVSKMFPLKSLSPVDFEFSFRHIQTHPAFDLEPVSGIVPANGEAEVTVTFAPYEFQTASMTVELTISQFNMPGIVCTFTGASKPGLLREKTLIVTETEILDPKFVSPLDRARTKKQQATTIKTRQQRKSETSNSVHALVLEKDGIHFPASLDNPHAVAKVLMQEPGKMKASEMRQNMLTSNVRPEGSSQQMKEAMFERAVRQNVYEERQNQLRWQVKVGDDPVSAQDRYRILEDRSTAMTQYQFKRREDPVIDDETSRLETLCTYRRTMRSVDELAKEDATFNEAYSSDVWSVRYSALQRFVQAARTIIIHNRASRRLVKLKTLVKNFNKVKNLGSSADNGQDKHEKTDLEEVTPNFTAEKITKYKFPTYVNPDVKDDMAPDALGIVQCSPTQIMIKREVPFLNLKVPQYYKLQGYKRHRTPMGYMAVKRTSGLRTGAEDEIIKIPDEVFSPCAAQEKPADYKRPCTTGMVPTSASTKKSAPEPSKKEVSHLSMSPRAFSLKPPSALFKPINYPSLQIMNPAPGLQAVVPLVPYSEVDHDYHLCPVPRYPCTDLTQTKSTAGLKKFLDREDTIKGVMGWKKFPSQGLISISNTPTLSSVWVPRWDNCFSKDLLPEDVPPLLERLDTDDAEDCVEFNEEESTVSLTPAMVSAQFPLIGSNLQPILEQKASAETFPSGNKLPRTNLPAGLTGPIKREQREEELEQFNSKKYNKLGSKFTDKMADLNAKVTDHNLILKS